MVRSVSVTVAGQKLSIRTDATDRELEELVELVNGRVREIQAGSTTASQAKVFLLAALSLADELRQARVEFEDLRRSATEQAQGALQFLGEDASSG